MKGKLYLIGKYWSVVGVDENLKVVAYPIHPDDAASAKEGAEVEFEIKENIIYTQGLGCTSTMVAKIIQPASEQQETWDDVFMAFVDAERLLFSHWLKENYNPTTKK